MKFPKAQPRPAASRCPGAGLWAPSSQGFRQVRRVRRVLVCTEAEACEAHNVAVESCFEKGDSFWMLDEVSRLLQLQSIVGFCEGLPGPRLAVACTHLLWDWDHWGGAEANR